MFEARRQFALVVLRTCLHTALQGVFGQAPLPHHNDRFYLANFFLNGMAYCHLAERRDATEDPKDADGLKAGHEAIAVVGSSDESYGDDDNDRVEPAPWVGGEGKVPARKGVEADLTGEEKDEGNFEMGQEGGGGGWGSLRAGNQLGFNDSGSEALSVTGSHTNQLVTPDGQNAKKNSHIKESACAFLSRTIAKRRQMKA